MATMARITTTSSAAAITTALTGLRPKIVDCGVGPERGEAATSPPESVRALLLASGNLLSPGVGATGVALGASVLGFAELPMLTSTLVLLPSAGAWLGAAWVEPGGLLLGACWAAAPPATARTTAMTTVSASVFIVHLPEGRGA